MSSAFHNSESMTTVKSICEIIEEFAPLSLCENYDNVGLLVGDEQMEVSGVLITLDVTEAVLDEAIQKKCNMIVSHHPLIFSGIKQVTTSTPVGEKICMLIKNNISHIAVHTNLDVVSGGTNDVLAELVGLKNIEVLAPTKEIDGVKYGIGRIGDIEESTFEAVAEKIKESLSLKVIKIVGKKDRVIKRAGLCTGSGVEFMKDAINKGADVYITSDIRFHESQKALDMGICLIDVTHYASENIVVPVISKFLSKVGDFEVVESFVDGQVFDYL